MLQTKNIAYVEHMAVLIHAKNQTLSHFAIQHQDAIPDAFALKDFFAMPKVFALNLKNVKVKMRFLTIF